MSWGKRLEAMCNGQGKEHGSSRQRGMFVVFQLR